MFCIIDIIHHRKSLKIPTSPLNRLISNHTGVIGEIRPSLNKHISTTSEAQRQSSNTPCVNFHLFDESKEDELDENDNEQPEIPSDEQSTDNVNTSNFHEKSNSLDKLSHRSSAERAIMDTTRDVSTRRHALDPAEQRLLRTYVRHRKNSIVQHVIGYNYDDNSTAGGLYTRVGIGSKLNKNI